jgi:hypothetical protein
MLSKPKVAVVSALALSILGIANRAQAQGLYVRLGAHEQKAGADAPVTFTITAFATRDLYLKDAPTFLLDDGQGFRDSLGDAAAVQASWSGDPEIPSGRPTKREYVLTFKHPGKYRVKARYRVLGSPLGPQLVTSNAVSIDVGEPVARDATPDGGH